MNEDGEKNPRQFLQMLENTGDNSRKLVSLIDQNRTAESSILDILAAIRTNLKEGGNLEFYLGIYSSLVTEFKVVNTQHLSLFLTYIGKNSKVDHHILLILVQNLQTDKVKTTQVITDYLELLVDEEDTLDYASFCNFLAVMEMCFPLIPNECAEIYTKDKTRDLFLSKSEEPHNFLPILKCISSSCIVENCRKLNGEMYSALLLRTFECKDVHVRLLASLDLAKEWTYMKSTTSNSKLKLTDIADVLMSYLNQEHEMEYVGYSIEALTYLTLFWETRELIRRDVLFVEKLVKALQKFSSADVAVNTSIQYGILSILANLSRIKEKDPREQLKHFSVPKEGSESTEEKSENIMLFNKELLESDHLVSNLYQIKTFEASSSNLMNVVIDIIYNISVDQKKMVRIELVKQGALTIVINYLIKHSKINKEENRVVSASLEKEENSFSSASASAAVFRLKALRSLARMLICVNPKLAFEKFDVRTSIPFLIEMLDDVDDNSQLMSALDKYEALLSLTNIASIDDSQLKDFIVNEIMPYIDNLILLDVQFQISTYELLNNLITQPILLAKFFNIKQDSNKRRLTISLKLLNSNDVDLQIIVAKFFVNATNFDMIADVIVDDQTVFEEILNVISIFT
ncbi:SHE4 [Candida oxycetoniae]|uniref:SHE4 n=1 Tax=Candida oxycetoniae TaxID=497107 RepID=A0AAI9SV68_9ASCO|nr:SHE4 [Candida oxycetoniae]KAI3403542.2 SHE4 [Candida oxycetoniae]